MATDDQAARPADAEMALAQAPFLPKPPLARPPPTRQTERKGRLNFLYLDRTTVQAADHCGKCNLTPVFCPLVLFEPVFEYLVDYIDRSGCAVAGATVR